MDGSVSDVFWVLCVKCLGFFKDFAMWGVGWFVSLQKFLMIDGKSFFYQSSLQPFTTKASVFCALIWMSFILKKLLATAKILFAPWWEFAIHAVSSTSARWLT